MKKDLAYLSFFLTYYFHHFELKKIVQIIVDHQYNFYYGNFDFSDDKKSALLCWISTSK